MLKSTSNAGLQHSSRGSGLALAAFRAMRTTSSESSWIPESICVPREAPGLATSAQANIFAGLARHCRDPRSATIQ